MKKILFVIILITFVLGSMVLIPMTYATALDYSEVINDPSGDVENSNADIIRVTSEKEGDNIKFVLTVSGEIKDSGPDDIQYYTYQIYIGNSQAIEFDNSETLVVQFVGEGNANYLNDLDPMLADEANYSIDGNKLTMFVPETAFATFTNYFMMASTSCTTFDSEGNLEGLPIVDNAYSWTDEGNGGDNEQEQDGGNGETKDGGNGTPGFELLIFVVAISFVLIFIKRKNKDK